MMLAQPIDACIVYPTISAVEAGYEVQVLLTQVDRQQHLPAQKLLSIDRYQ